VEQGRITLSGYDVDPFGKIVRYEEDEHDGWTGERIHKKGDPKMVE